LINEHSFVAYRKNQEFRAQQELLTNSAQGAAHLSGVRYQGGDTSYLEVLTNQTNYISVELNLAQARLNELLALVGFYKALGGGWQQRDALEQVGWHWVQEDRP
jgi:outer membrane protein, multidrug efflux system